MNTIKVSRSYNATADYLWSIVGNPANIADWHPVIAQSPTADGKRICTLADGAVVKEDILSHDDTARSYSYAITDSPLPMRDYTSTIRVEAVSGGRAQVTWEADFVEVGIERDALEEKLAGLYNAGFDALEARV